MTTNQNQLTRIDPLWSKCCAMLIGLALSVSGLAQTSDTIFVCPQSDFFTLEEILFFSYINPASTEFLLDTASIETQRFFYLDPAWAANAGDSVWEVASNFGGASMFIQMANPDSCLIAAQPNPSFSIDFDCDSTDIPFTATIPDDVTLWDEARLISHPTDSTFQDLSTSESDLDTDFIGVLPEGAETDSSIFCTQWSEIVNGAQLNILSVSDTLTFPMPAVQRDTLYACRGSGDSIADFNLFDIEFLDGPYASITIFDSSGLMGDPILPEDGYSSMEQDTLYVLLEYVNPHCADDTALVDLIIDEYPEFTPFSDAEICASETIPIDIVNGLLPWTIEYNGISIDVINETITFDPVLVADTITSFIIIDSLFCVNELVLQDTLFLFPIPTFTQLDDSICVADQIELIVSGGPLTVFTTDSDSLNFGDIVSESTIVSTAPVQGGVITITGMESANCSNDEEFSILVFDLPVVVLLDSLICGNNGSATLNEDLLNEVIALENGETSAWFFLDESPVVQDSSFSTSIELVLEIENLTGCVAQDSIYIYAFESPVVLLWDDTLTTCIGDTIDLTSIIPAIEVSYFDSLETQWTVHDADGDLVPLSQVYFDPELGLSIEGGEWDSPLLINIWTDPPHPSCDQVSDSAYFFLNPLPEYSLISGACAGEGMFIEFESWSNTEALTYTWAGGSPVTISAGSPIPTEDTEAGPTAELDLELISDQGCVLVAQESVQIFPSPVISAVSIFSSPELILCENDTDVPIQAFPLNLSAYFWDIFGNAVSSNDQDLDSEFLVDALSSSGAGSLTLIAHDSIVFMNNSFVCVSEEYEFPIDVTGVRCEIEEVYQFPGGLFVLEVENADPDELDFVEWTVEGQDPVLAGAFVYLPGILNEPDAQLMVKTSLFGPNICTCQRSVDTFGLVADLGKSVSAFPNPVVGNEVNVLLPDVFLDKSSEFRLFTASAELVFSKRMMVSQPLTKLNLPSDLEGIFILEIVNEDFTMRSKLIIE